MRDIFKLVTIGHSTSADVSTSRIIIKNFPTFLRKINCCVMYKQAYKLSTMHLSMLCPTTPCAGSAGGFVGEFCWRTPQGVGDW